MAGEEDAVGGSGTGGWQKQPRKVAGRCSTQKNKRTDRRGEKKGVGHCVRASSSKNVYSPNNNKEGKRMDGDEGKETSKHYF